MGKSDKEPRKPSKYNKFVKANYDKYGGDFKKIGAAWRKQEGNPKKKSTPKVKPRSGSTVSKPKPKSRPKGEMERKRIAAKKVFDDFARALGVPSSKTTFKVVGNVWVLKAGNVKVKRIKLSEAMAEFKKRARKRL